MRVVLIQVSLEEPILPARAEKRSRLVVESDTHAADPVVHDSPWVSITLAGKVDCARRRAGSRPSNRRIPERIQDGREDGFVDMGRRNCPQPRSGICRQVISQQPRIQNPPGPRRWDGTSVFWDEQRSRLGRARGFVHRDVNPSAHTPPRTDPNAAILQECDRGRIGPKHQARPLPARGAFGPSPTRRQPLP